MTKSVAMPRAAAARSAAFLRSSSSIGRFHMKPASSAGQAAAAVYGLIVSAGSSQSPKRLKPQWCSSAR